MIKKWVLNFLCLFDFNYAKLTPPPHQGQPEHGPKDLRRCHYPEHGSYPISQECLVCKRIELQDIEL